MKLRTLARKALRNRAHPAVAVGVGLGVTQVANIATTAWLHRSLAHKAVEFDPRVVKFFDLVIRCATGMDPNEWAAVHQQHHAHSDELGDPHSRPKTYCDGVSFSPQLPTSTSRCSRVVAGSSLASERPWHFSAPQMDSSSRSCTGQPTSACRHP